MSAWADVAALLEAGTALREDGRPAVFPGCVAGVMQGGRWVFHEAFGVVGLGEGPTTRGTRYDLASLTKPVVAALVARVVRDGRWALDAPVTAHATLAQLLGHASGWPAHRDFSDRTPQGVRDGVLSEPLERPAGRAAVYSDLGYMALGWALEAHEGAALPQLLSAARDELALGGIAYGPCSGAAPTERDARRGLIRGQVHDPNAWALGGVAGHAGLFGTCADVAQFGAALLREVARGTPLGGVLTQFWSTSAAQEPTTWRLGVDTPSATGSSAGGAFGPRAVGHLGFTGTSLWLDPDDDVVVVLLSNRVHPVAEASPAIRQLRPRFHAAVRAALDA